MTRGRPDQLEAVARLHVARVSEGFLSSLGPPLLARIYRRVLKEEGSFLLVAKGDGAGVAGFVAGTEDTGRLYRSFVVRDGLGTAVRFAPALARSLPRALETLCYGATFGEGEGGNLPRAELLSLAVAGWAEGQGLGGRLVVAFQAEMQARAVPGARVVVGPANHRAIRLYRRCGFRSMGGMEVHRGAPSQVLVWP